MVVRKFEAPTLEQALTLVKRAMGPDALILSTTQKRAKWFNRPVIEVAAAVAQPAAQHPVKKEESFDDDKLAEIFPHRKTEDEELMEQLQQSRGLSAKEENLRKTAQGAYAGKKPQPAPAPVKPQSYTSHRPVNPGKSPEESHFEELGFSSQTSKEFTRRILLEFSQGDRADAHFMNKERVKLVSSGVKTLPSDMIERRRSWAIVGNPGAGKTATCVKLALHLKTRNQAVSLVSADKRKLVGEQELYSYARMLGVPFYSVFQENRSKSGIEIIDTPAMGYVQPELATELGRICRESSVILVLDAGQRLNELLRWVEEAEGLGPVGIFFTRVDLVQGAGVVHDVLKAAKLPLLGMSMGASFRNTLQFFEPAELARTLLKIPTSPARVSA